MPTNLRRRAVPRLPRPVTKMGEVRKVIREHPGLKPREIFRKLEAKNLSIKITAGDVHRVIARMTSNEHVERDGGGGVVLTPKAPKD